jgi:hypothetical protein
MAGSDASVVSLPCFVLRFRIVLRNSIRVAMLKTCIVFCTDRVNNKFLKYTRSVVSFDIGERMGSTMITSTDN